MHLIAFVSRERFHCEEILEKHQIFLLYLNQRHVLEPTKVESKPSTLEFFGRHEFIVANSLKIAAIEVNEVLRNLIGLEIGASTFHVDELNSFGIGFIDDIRRFEITMTIHRSIHERLVQFGFQLEELSTRCQTLQSANYDRKRDLVYGKHTYPTPLSTGALGSFSNFGSDLPI